jgi:RND superfamily putative drug exporter
MTSVFSGFIGADNALIKMIGFGMAAAVLFDAFVVRMALVPAALALLGKAAWWMPRWLDRVLPRVDVEGEALATRGAGHQIAAAEAPGDANTADDADEPEAERDVQPAAV